MENENPKLQGESACQTTVRKSLSDRETINMKAVVNHYENSCEIIIPVNRNMLECVNMCELWL